MVFSSVPSWRSGRVFGALVVSLVLALHAGTDVFNRLEQSFFDFVTTATSRKPSAHIALIAIDDKSLAALGPWPWPRAVHARLIDKLAEVKPKVVVLAVPFTEPQRDAGLIFVQRIKAVLAQTPLSAIAAGSADQGGQPVQQALAGLIREAEAELDGDAHLTCSLQQAGNVLLVAMPTLTQVPGRPEGSPSPFVFQSALEKPVRLDWPGGQFQTPIARLGMAAAGVGPITWFADEDGVVRSERLLVAHGDKAIPSLALLAAAGRFSLKTADIKMARGPVLQLDSLRIGMSDSAEMWPHFYKTGNGRSAFTTDSFADVLSGKTPASRYANKVVFIGVTAPGVGSVLAVPGNPAMSSVESLAHATSSLLQGHGVYQPSWAIGVALVLAVLASAYIALGLPYLAAGTAAAITLAWVASLLAAEFWGLTTGGLWVPLVFPATLLALGHMAQMTHRLLTAPVGHAHQPVDKAAENDRMMGLALQGQGELDMALERFLRVPMHAAIADDFYWLAMDFEAKHLFEKAQAVYVHLLAFDPAFKDVKDRLSNARVKVNPTDQPSVSPHPVTASSGITVQKTTLGRYQVEKELGKGAMGEVYLGQDPKIGRQVALKTLALGNEFDGLDLVDARERFFREAKAAGRLQHPGIVTIFDVGEEGGLAFIAMEYLKGHDLQQSCKRRALMPVPRVLSIVARVAQALAYAHRMKVIHRDIKPGNVMYDILTDTVKVTDFGIARVTDGNKTRTGVVMGTPSYMSPEQLAGLPLDGRSDLYSLGIMMFQMLTGVLPFSAESLAELMSKIATQDAPDVCQLRPELPKEVAVIVARLLRKSPQERYQEGEALAIDLSAHAQRLQMDPLPSQGVPSFRQGAMSAGSIDLEL